MPKLKFYNGRDVLDTEAVNTPQEVQALVLAVPLLLQLVIADRLARSMNCGKGL